MTPMWVLPTSSRGCKKIPKLRPSTPFRSSHQMEILKAYNANTEAVKQNARISRLAYGLEDVLLVE